MRTATRAQLRPKEGFHLSLRALVVGVIACAALSLVAAAILGIIMFRTLLPEAVLPTIMGAVNLAALICGGYLAGRRAQATGWLNGGLAAMIYSGLLLLLGVFFFPGPTAALIVLRRLAVGFVLGALGGTVGVNV